MYMVDIKWLAELHCIAIVDETKTDNLVGSVYSPGPTPIIPTAGGASSFFRSPSR
jgi:hypothetical protein